MTDTPTSDADPLGALSKVKGTGWRTFVIPEVKMMYVQVNKNACTSLKWMIAEVAGEDLTQFGPSMEASTSGPDDIHDRRQWRRIPKLSQLDPALRAHIHPDNGWFVFGVTRDPRSRLFSAWQSKLLLDNPGYIGMRGQTWYPRHPATTESVIADFATFVDLFERDPSVGIRRDGHFRDQVEMLHLDLVDYTEIYDIRELDRLQTDLRSHLDGVGWTGKVVLPRFNDTPLRPNGQPFVDGIRERVEKIYAADFQRFGDRWDFAAIEKVPDWTPADLAQAEKVADHGRHLGFLLGETKKFRGAVEAQRRRADAEKLRADDLARKLRAATPVPPRARLRSRLRRAALALRRTVRRNRAGRPDPRRESTTRTERS